jgi:hypothetical protein
MNRRPSTALTSLDMFRRFLTLVRDTVESDLGALDREGEAGLRLRPPGYGRRYPQHQTCWDQAPDPNGLAFSPDYNMLYVILTGKGQAMRPGGMIDGTKCGPDGVGYVNGLAQCRPIARDGADGGWQAPQPDSACPRCVVHLFRWPQKPSTVMRPARPLSQAALESCPCGSMTYLFATPASNDL